MRTRLNTTKALVKTILEQDKKARNSDSYLYLKVINSIAEKQEINLNDIAVTDFLLNISSSPFPPFESVRRSRQKLRAEFPHLEAEPEIEIFRADNEEAYREFARARQ